ADIKDGLSSTLLVGERPIPWNLDYIGWWLTDLGAYPEFGAPQIALGVNENEYDPNMGMTGVPVYLDTYSYRYCPKPSENVDYAPDYECAYHFWSYHPGGAHFVFADGHVDKIKYDVGQQTINALATRAGKEPVTGDW